MREFSRDNREEEVQFIDVTLADQDEERIREWKECGDIGGGCLDEDDWRSLSSRVTRQYIRFSIELGCKQVSCLITSGLMWINCGEDNYIVFR